jgi:ATP-binding cassette subfamily B protein
MQKRAVTSQAMRRVVRAYLGQYKKYPGSALTAFTLPAIGMILISFVPPIVIGRLVDVIAAGKGFAFESIVPYAAIFGGSWMLGEVFWRIGFVFLARLESKSMAELGKEAFDKLTGRDYDFYTNNFVGSLTKRHVAYWRGFETFTDTLVINVGPSLLPVIFACIVLGRYSLWIPTILVISLVIAVSVGIPIIRRRMKLVIARHEAGSKASGYISDAITNMLAVKSFAQEDQEKAGFAAHADDYAVKYKKAFDYQNLRFEMTMSPIYVATNLVGLLAAAFFTATIGLPAGALVIVFSYYTQITGTFWNISRIYRSIESSVSEAAEFTELVMEPAAVLDTPDARRLDAAEPRINFDTVGFRYAEQNDKEPFLNGFNLEIPHNQKVGLVGPSGGGKTTITKLLLRFIDIGSGTISVNGQDISRVSQKSLREAIAYVPQEPMLFHRSLFDNIAYGRSSATKEEVVHAAKLARADEFINRLPQGYDTMVGERGVKLSGGQRQRVAIARAILKNAPILVLDEATSSLDSESEKYIQEGLWELMKNKTALVIAHRLSTIKHLDRIIVLDQGKIVQDGTHEELIKKPGLYAKLWSHQSGEFLED